MTEAIEEIMVGIIIVMIDQMEEETTMNVIMIEDIQLDVKSLVVDVTMKTEMDIVAVVLVEVAVIMVVVVLLLEVVEVLLEVVMIEVCNII